MSGTTADTPRSPSSRRIGLFGGTFDPVHHGHLVAAWHVRHRLALDEIWLVVANDPWQKRDDRQITPASTRMRWVQLALAGVDGLVASDIEIELGGASYTIDTVTELSARRPDVDWFLVVGADTAAQLDTWHRADELRTMVEVIVVNRPGLDAPHVPPGWQHRHVLIPALELSSTELRELAADGISLRFLTPDPVADDIERRGVFAQQSSGQLDPGESGP